MVKKILVGLSLALLLSTCFAGYSSGGRSGYSGSSRSYSSSSGRSGYSRSTNIAPQRSYSNGSRAYSGSSTVIHNNHYSHSGYGGGFGGGFFSGMLGGYIGGSLANNHAPVVVAGSGMPMGQGALVDGGQPYAVAPYNYSGLIVFFILAVGVIVLIVFFATRDTTCSHNRNRW